MDKPKTTARVIVTYQCNRSCLGCCNGHDNDIKKISNVDELLKYDEIVITGGEPMLIKEKLFDFLLQLRNMEYNGKIYMYTAFWNPGIYSNEILQSLDGITFTIHADSTDADIVALKSLSRQTRLADPKFSSRLIIDSRVFEKYDLSNINLNSWDVIRKLQWKDKCELAEHEELVSYLL